LDGHSSRHRLFSATETLTLSGYDTIAHYNTVLAAAAAQEAQVTP
jgi:hypothetical protein